MPLKQSLPATEKDDPLIPPWMSDAPSPSFVERHSSARGNYARTVPQATELGKRLMALGVGSRAIVSARNINHEKAMEFWANPMNWGIVISMRLLEEKPVKVRWADGTLCDHDGPDLIVIYPARGKDDFISDFKGRSPLV